MDETRERGRPKERRTEGVEDLVKDRDLSFQECERRDRDKTKRNVILNGGDGS